MKTNYIYLKTHVVNNKRADNQVHIMKASNNKNLFQNLLWFLYIFWRTKLTNSNKLEMVKCESLLINMLQTNTRKNQ